MYGEIILITFFNYVSYYPITFSNLLNGQISPVDGTAHETFSLHLRRCTSKMVDYLKYLNDEVRVNS